MIVLTLVSSRIFFTRKRGEVRRERSFSNFYDCQNPYFNNHRAALKKISIRYGFGPGRTFAIVSTNVLHFYAVMTEKKKKEGKKKKKNRAHRDPEKGAPKQL